ncbi:unnamed protein product [Staurois parvus]|uniref:Uncharacterized protein n=1 Tax=Staurois parvus TaxID=386267 RepID=A0ABN9F3K3_9NEOB|nr:unnamed protein product [Staurois parvus]
MGPLCPHPHSKKPMKGTRGIPWGPLLTLGPRAVPSTRMVSPPLGIRSQPGSALLLSAVSLTLEAC